MLRMHGHFDKLSPFDMLRMHGHFDKLSANGVCESSALLNAVPIKLNLKSACAP